METVIEQQRRYHEERERLIEAIVAEKIRSKGTFKDQVIADQIIRMLLDRYMETTENLAALYEDKDRLRYEEVKALGSEHQFSEFYIKVKQLREKTARSLDNNRFHAAVPISVELDNLISGLIHDADSTLVSFTDEECWGRCLDMTSLHQLFLQLRPVHQTIDYLAYVDQFDRLYEQLTRERKLSLANSYKRYLTELIDYLRSFLQRVRPLQEFVEGQDQVKKDNQKFETEWTSGTFPGWPSSVNQLSVPADLSSFSGAEELASLGLNGLKQALLSMHLKCGGTLEQRANRLWEAIVEIRSGKGEPHVSKNRRGQADKAKEIARLESEVYRLSDMVSVQRINTIENVQRKQARAAFQDEDAVDEDLADGGKRMDISGAANDLDDDDDIDDDLDGGSNIYNPKNLPLGWDGKPIPYWLYKLHGLNIYYNCEICGNFKYRGPKAFQRHFAEWRHAHGMRCLGIPNTAHFANITLIEDAVALWDRLRRKKETDNWKPEIDEEFEDSNGNVVSKKVYEDLRRQGLL